MTITTMARVLSVMEGSLNDEGAVISALVSARFTSEEITQNMDVAVERARLLRVFEMMDGFAELLTSIASQGRVSV